SDGASRRRERRVMLSLSVLERSRTTSVKRLVAIALADIGWGDQPMRSADQPGCCTVAGRRAAWSFPCAAIETCWVVWACLSLRPPYSTDACSAPTYLPSIETASGVVSEVLWRT